MGKSLGGTLFIRNGEKFDYCYKEAIQCLTEFCDTVAICECGSDDKTRKELYKIWDQYKGIRLSLIPAPEWDRLAEMGKERLSYFTNHAIEILDTDYVFNLQGDEIVDPKSYKWIRKAIEDGEEGYLCSRINLWGSPYHQLNVPQERKPCSTEILRLAKGCYRAYDDAESLRAPASAKYIEQIKIWHMGFVRKREIHPIKIREMQENVFKCGVDKKLDGMEIFDPWAWFSKDDVTLINEPLPPLIQKWAAERVY